MSSEAAVAANYTRKVRAAAAEMAGTYGDAKYDLLDDLIVPYLVAAVGEGGRVADLLGGGRSAKALTAAGLRVVSVDDLRLYGDKLKHYHVADRRQFHRDVAQTIADDAGVERLFIGDASKAVECDLGAYYFDGMGPLGPGNDVGLFLKALRHRPEIGHVVVTYLASRLKGLGDISAGDREVYDIAAEATMRKIGFRGVLQVGYTTNKHQPMGILFGCNHSSSRGPRCRAWMRVYDALNRERDRAYQRRYQEANRDHLNALARDRFRERWASDREFRERELAYNRKWIEDNKERARERRLAYYQRTRDKVIANVRRYRAENRDEINARARAKRVSDPSVLEKERAYVAANREHLRELRLQREAARKAVQA